ncbi:MAG: RidA family protein [Thermoguttaceae bacterium]
MRYRLVAAAASAVCVVGLTCCPAAEQQAGKPAPQAAGSKIQYVSTDDSGGTPQAVVVPRMPLAHTRQLFPLDREGKLVGDGSADRQVQQVLDNLEAVLKDCGSGMDKLVRVNVYALSTATVTGFRQQLEKKLGPQVRPVVTAILTPLPRRGALLAVDAVAGAADAGNDVVLKRCPAVAGDDKCADVAVLPAGGIAYLSGQPEEFSLTVLPATRSMTNLVKTLEGLKLSARDVVQVKVFVQPVTSADEVLREIQAFFPGQPTPPVVFVEWLASMPIEIEMIARLPLSDQSAEGVVYYDPPEYRPSNTFSKVALMRAEKQIYIAGLFSREPTRGEPQANQVFGQLGDILKKTGSDMRHLVKATYYVSDADAARWVDRARPLLFDETRPPAASKLMVHAVGESGRTMTVDMIAVEAR